MKAGNGFLVWENADELYRYVWFADSSCAWRIPLTHPMDWLLCEATCTPVAKQAGAIRNPPPLPKGLAIELSGKWQYLLTWNTHILPIGVGVGQGLGKDPLMQLWPRERPDQEVLWCTRVGALLAGGCLAVAALLCLKGGRDCICSELQEADEVLICWVAVSLGLCSQ